LKELLIL